MAFTLHLTLRNVLLNENTEQLAHVQHQTDTIHLL